MPSLFGARAGVLGLLVGAVAAFPLAAPAPPGALAVVRPPAGGPGDCALARAGEGAPCPCEAWPAEVRVVLGLALPLNRVDARALERLPGVGPVRAAAIVAERARGGPFADPAQLERVPGIGPVTAARLGPRLFVGGPDPACPR